MGFVPLSSLEIRGFRAFRHLEIPSLGRVNLITGKNSVGKTCLLEALRLYASRGSFLLMQSLLKSRDEGTRVSNRPVDNSETECLRYLFYGRKPLQEQDDLIQIGPIDSLRDKLIIEVNVFAERIGEYGQQKLFESEPWEMVDSATLGIIIKWKNMIIRSHPVDRDLRSVGRTIRFEPELEKINYKLISADGLDRQELGQLWDSIALTDLEENVLAALRIIVPTVERITLVVEREADIGRVPIVKLKDSMDPIPLRSLGEGMNRIFGIAMALVNAADGMFLIDEVDSGLHYSVQPDLWKLIFRIAKQLNIQVFATTHNWDCVSAFQSAAAENQDTEGFLIRLHERGKNIVATVFDERKLGVATREEIEVR